MIFLIGVSIGLGVFLILRETLFNSQKQLPIFHFRLHHSHLTLSNRTSDLAITRTAEEQFAQRVLRSGLVGGLLAVFVVA